MIGLFKEQQKHSAMKDQLKRIAEDKVLRENICSEEKIEELREIRRFQQEKQEKFLHDNIAHELERKKLIEKQKWQEERLASEIKKQKLDTVRESKIRQQLRRNCPELRELQSKLLLANVSKERSVQLAQKSAIKEVEKKEKEEFANEMKIIKEKEELEQRLRDQKEFQAKLKYHKDLDDQRDLQVKTNKEAYADFVKERILVDELMKKIIEEDIRAAQEKIDSQHKMQEYIREYKQAREECTLQEKLRQAEENAKVSNYLEVQDVRKQEQEELRKIKVEDRDKIQQDLVSFLDQVYESKEKEEKLRTDLAIEELEEAEKKREEEIAHERLEKEAEIQKVQEMQMWLKYQRAEKEKKDEEIFRQHLMEKLAEEDRLDILSIQKRRLKQAEHRRIARELIEERRARIVAEREREMAEYYKQQELEECRKQIIEDERQRLLQENATKLLGYLPKGIVKNTDDINRLGEEFQQFYLSRPLDSDEEL